MDSCEPEEPELDPRIQIELEKLNTATDEINKLEIELDEANTTFHMLLNESTRRLKILSKKLGGCIERARPYYDAVEIARKAQIECQKAAVLFQRANEIHAAAKETVAVAEQGFMTNQHEFDNAWQEMLNHATMKVMDAENQKAERGREHQRRATLFTAAEQKVQTLEERLRRSIIKSRPYFEEKSLCQEQLNTQKERIEELQKAITDVKTAYANSLKALEAISEEIHRRRKGSTKSFSEDAPPAGPREPGVGAERSTSFEELPPASSTHHHQQQAQVQLPDFNVELDRCEIRSLGSKSASTCSLASDFDADFAGDKVLDDVERLKEKVKELSVRPVYGGEGKSSDPTWESELKDTVSKLDRMLMMQECAEELKSYKQQQQQQGAEGSCAGGGVEGTEAIN